MIVGGSSPQTQNVRAVLVEDIRRIDAVAKALVHGLALAVDRPAVGDALLKGRALTESADRREQRGLEPATVLVETSRYIVAGQKP